MIAIIGVLIALLLPAIQAAREAARRTHAKTTSSKLVWHCITFTTPRAQLPQGVYTDPRDDKSPGLSWLSRLLPFVEEQTKYDQIAKHVPPGFTGSAWEYYNPFGYAASLPGKVIPTSDQPITSFNCPSADFPLLTPSDIDDPFARGLATTSYKGSSGALRRGVLLRPDPTQAGRVRKLRFDDGGNPQILEITQPHRTRYRFKDVTDGLEQDGRGRRVGLRHRVERRAQATLADLDRHAWQRLGRSGPVSDQFLHQLRVRSQEGLLAVRRRPGSIGPREARRLQ